METAKQRGEFRNDIDIEKASFVVDAVMDRFLQAQTVLHFDAGLGLFKCSEEDVNGWIAGLVDIIRLGIGKGDRHIMGAYKDTIIVNANVEMTTGSLQTIVENAKKKAGRDKKGVYRVDTADKVSEIISRFLLEKDFEGYVKNIGKP